MARFVLIHGACQGAWCWREVELALSALGHEAIAIDLPGHGEDRSPVESITMEDYVKCAIAAAPPDRGRSILVGHSMGGAIIRQAAGLAPDHVAVLVSIAALLPASGSSLFSTFDGLDPEYLAQFQWASDRRSVRLSVEGVRRFFLHDCPEETVESVLPRLTAEPVAPYEAPLCFTETPAPRYYIECLRDRIVPIALQRSMHAGYAKDSVYTLETGHAPYLAAPRELAAVLHQIAERV